MMVVEKLIYTPNLRKCELFKGTWDVTKPNKVERHLIGYSGGFHNNTLVRHIYDNFYT